MNGANAAHVTNINDMTISISVDGDEENNTGIIVRIECDSDHGFLPVTLDLRGTWYPDIRHEAVIKGWRFASTGGKVYCPDCPLPD